MIRLENVSKYYHGDGNVVLGLHKVNLELNIGEFVAITGESGSGKSTLLNVISGVDTYEDGEIYFNNEETSYYDESDWENYRKKYIGFVFQNYNLIDSYTVLENVETALVINGVSKKERRKRAIEILKSVGLENHLKHKGTKLSGGEKQRLSIARAIAKDAPVIVADEPTGNLDSKTGKQIINILKELSKTKLVVVVTHNYDLVENHATRFIRVYDGMIVENKLISKPVVEDEIIIEDIEVPIYKKATPFALWNLKNQPKATFLTLAVALITTIIIAFLSASYFENRVSTGYAYNHYFFNSPPERIIIKKKDKTVFTDEDFTNINNLSNIGMIIKEDIVFSQQINLMPLEIEDNYDYRRPLYFYGQTRHLDETKKLKLDAGRWPEKDNEVLISSRYEELDYYLDKEFQSNINIGYSDFLGPKLKVVGIVEHVDSWSYSNKVYMSGKIYEQLNKEIIYKIKNFNVTLNNYSISEYKLEADANLKNNEVILELDPYSSFHFDKKLLVGENLSYATENDNFTFTIKNINYLENKVNNRFIIIKISNENYNSFHNLENLQHTILVKNHTSIDKTIRELEGLGFYAFNPLIYNDGNRLSDTIMNILSGIFYASIIFVIYLIAYVTIKTIFSSKNRDQLILKSIGLDSRSIGLIYVIQITIYFIISFFILIPLAIVLSKTNQVFELIFKALSWKHYLFLLLINIALGIFIAMKVNRSTHKKSIISSMKAE